MATPGRRTNPPLSRTLKDEPYRFDFFQAVRLLERIHPGRQPVGRLGPPAEEVARFAGKVSMDFPPSQLDRLDDPDAPGRPPLLTVAFMGLAGAHGALPLPYTEELLYREREFKDRTAAAFLDLFNHRLISLFYRAWEKHHPVAVYERALFAPAVGGANAPPVDMNLRDAPCPGDTPPSNYLFNLIGLGPAASRGRQEFPDRVLLFYAGLFAQQHRSAVGLERMLGEYFQTPIKVRQFVGQWLTLDPADRTALGARHNELGLGVVLGSRVRDEQGKIRLVVGPLPLERFLEFQPDRPAFRALGQLARLYARSELDIDVQLILEARAVPRLRFDGPERPRLGRTTWALTGPAERDADDPIFPVPASA